MRRRAARTHTIEPVTPSGPATAATVAGWFDRVDRWSRTHPVLPDSLLALAVAAVVGSASLGVMQVADAPEWVMGVSAVCCVVLHASVALRRQATAVAFSLASIAMLGLVALAVSAAGALMVTARLATSEALVDLPAGWLSLLGMLALVVATWSLGRFQYQRRRNALAEHEAATRQAVSEERERIARDMHDIVAHSLAVIVRQAEGGAYVAARSPDATAQGRRRTRPAPPGPRSPRCPPWSNAYAVPGCTSTSISTARTTR
ncbi:MAG: hypothetical protein GEU93_16320 [Propionibacteriales bacterium]|nr:hypothetical protein [Propionibacteriales bacterium]